jgi:hypothetical protein
LAVRLSHDILHNDIPHNDIPHNDTQHYDTQHNDIQHNNKYNVTLSIMTDHCYAELSLMLRVTYKPFKLSVIMVNVVMLSVVEPLGRLLIRSHRKQLLS